MSEESNKNYNLKFFINRKHEVVIEDISNKNHPFFEDEYDMAKMLVLRR